MFHSKFSANELLGKIADAQNLHPNESGHYKKNYVLQEMRCEIGSEAYERYLPVIDPMIDLLKEISNEQCAVFTLLRPNKKKWWKCF